MAAKKTTTFKKLDRLHKVLIGLQILTLLLLFVVGFETQRAHNRIDVAEDLTYVNSIADKVFLLQDCLAGKEQFCPKKR